MDFSKYDNKMTIKRVGAFMDQFVTEIDNTPLTKTERDLAFAEAQSRAKQAANQSHSEYMKEENRLKALFFTDAADDIGYDELPQELQDKLNTYAYEEARSGGYSGVYNHLLDLAPLVIAAYEAGLQAGSKGK